MFYANEIKGHSEIISVRYTEASSRYLLACQKITWFLLIIISSHLYTEILYIRPPIFAHEH